MNEAETQVIETVKTAVKNKFDEVKDGVNEVRDRVLELEQRGSAPPYVKGGHEHNLGKVLKHLADPSATPLDGYEREYSDEQKHQGLSVPLNGAVFCPLGSLEKKTLDYGALSPTATGSSVVNVDTRGRDLIEVLRERSVVMGLGPTVIRLSANEVDIPLWATGNSSYWVTGEGEDITASNPVLERVQLRPKFCGAIVTATLKMMALTDGVIGHMIGDDLTRCLAEEIDKQALQGDGTSGAPTGVENQSNVLTDVWTGSPSLPTFDDTLEMIRLLAAAKTLSGRIAGVTDPATYKTLASTLKTAAVSGYLVEDGQVNGYPITQTTNCSANTILFGDWSQLIVAEWGSIALASDPYTNFASGSVVFRALMPMDVAVRHPQSFVKSSKV